MRDGFVCHQEQLQALEKMILIDFSWFKKKTCTHQVFCGCVSNHLLALFYQLLKFKFC